MDHSFSIREALRESWALLRTHSLLVFQIVLTFFVLQVISAIVNKVLGGTVLGFFAAVLIVVVTICLGAGALIIMLKLVRREHAHYRELWPPARLAVAYFLASLLSGVIVLLPMLLLALLVAFASFSGGVVGIVLAAAGGVVCVCASVYLAVRYIFVKVSAVDGESITGSLRRSASMTHGQKGHLLLLVLALIALNILGAILLLVGLLVTIPLSMLMLVTIYQKLLPR